MAEAERDRTRERIAEVKDDQRQRNRYLGGDMPFGFDVKAASWCRPERAGRDPAHGQAAGRRTSLREIAAAMERDGFEISHMGVDKIVKAAAAGERRRRCHDRL